MSIAINRTLAIRQGPFERGVDLTILENVENMLKTEKGPGIRVFSVNYKEIKSTKPGYRMFYIKEAFNQRDK